MFSRPPRFAMVRSIRLACSRATYICGAMAIRRCRHDSGARRIRWIRWHISSSPPASGTYVGTSSVTPAPSTRSSCQRAGSHDISARPTRHASHRYHSTRTSSGSSFSRREREPSSRSIRRRRRSRSKAPCAWSAGAAGGSAPLGRRRAAFWCAARSAPRRCRSAIRSSSMTRRRSLRARSAPPWKRRGCKSTDALRSVRRPARRRKSRRSPHRPWRMSSPR